MSRIIEVIVNPQGETSIQTKGFVGGECIHASKFLEQALGVTLKDRKTPDFFQTTENQQRIQQQ